MELRKLQKLGTSSYFITLPKGWIRNHELKAGDKVGVSFENDGSLRVVPLKRGVYKPRKSLVINLDRSKSSIGYIPAVITCAYILGYDTVEFNSLTGISKQELSTINKALSTCTGMVAIEESKSKVLIECVIDSSKIDSTAILKRTLSIVVDTLMNITVKNITSSTVRYKVPESLRDELRKLHNLVMRVLVSTRDVSVESKGMVYFVAAALLEMLVDYMLSAASISSKLRGSLDKDTVERIKHFYNEVSEAITVSVLSLTSLSLKMAQLGVNKCRSLLARVDSLLVDVIMKASSPEEAAYLANIIVKTIDSVKIALVISNMALCNSITEDLSFSHENV